MKPPRLLLPPVYLLFAVVAMTALHRWVPGFRWLNPPWNYVGAIFVVLGIAIIGVSARLFQRKGTTIKPFRESSALIIEGPYRYTRNPIYLGMVCILTGTAILLGTLTPIAVIPLFIWWITTRFILKEEQMLLERFGDEYRRYKQWVRRWV